MSKGSSDFRQWRRWRAGESHRPNHSGPFLGANSVNVIHRMSEWLRPLARHEQRLPLRLFVANLRLLSSILHSEIGGDVGVRPVDKRHETGAALPHSS